MCCSEKKRTIVDTTKPNAFCGKKKNMNVTARNKLIASIWITSVQHWLGKDSSIVLQFTPSF